MKKAKRMIPFILAAALLAAILPGCGGKAAPTPPSTGTAFTTTVVGTFSTMDPIAVIVMKSGDQITLELRPDQAPNTVNNFIYLANSGFYDGLIFHRIIKGFMIQGGDPQGTGTGGPGWTIPDEFKNGGFDGNTLSHVTGTISMANTGAANSAGSQFFICDSDTYQSSPLSSFLDGGYAAFGSVIQGIDVVHNIANLPVTDNNGTVKRNSSGGIAPLGTIAYIRVDTKGVNYPKPNISSGTMPG